MNAKYLTTALAMGLALTPLACAQGEEAEGAAAEPKQAAALPGEKLAVQQWKVPPLFFERNNASPEKAPDPVLVLKTDYGIDFPANSGATASYSPKDGKLTVKNTPRNLKAIDAIIKQYMSTYRPVGRTAEDFKKWAKEEYKRRQAAVKLMEKANDDKSAKKALDKLMKIYKAQKKEDKPLGDLSVSYKGALNAIDQKTRDAVGKKFAKQLEEIYDQQQRLLELEDNSDGMLALRFYAERVYVFAEDDRTGKRWEITEEGIEETSARKRGNRNNMDCLPRRVGKKKGKK